MAKDGKGQEPTVYEHPEERGEGRGEIDHNAPLLEAISSASNKVTDTQASSASASKPAAVSQSQADSAPKFSGPHFFSILKTRPSPSEDSSFNPRDPLFATTDEKGNIDKFNTLDNSFIANNIDSYIENGRSSDLERILARIKLAKQEDSFASLPKKIDPAHFERYMRLALERSNNTSLQNLLDKINAERENTPTLDFIGANIETLMHVAISVKNFRGAVLMVERYIIEKDPSNLLKSNLLANINLQHVNFFQLVQERNLFATVLLSQCINHGVPVNDLMNAADRNRLLLHYAATAGNVKAIELLSNQGSNKELLNHNDDNGVTPLILAAYHFHREATQYLLGHGAEYAHPDNTQSGQHGRTAQQAAAETHTQISALQSISREDKALFNKYLSQINGYFEEAKRKAGDVEKPSAAASAPPVAAPSISKSKKEKDGKNEKASKLPVEKKPNERSDAQERDALLDEKGKGRAEKGALQQVALQAPAGEAKEPIARPVNPLQEAPSAAPEGMLVPIESPLQKLQRVYDKGNHPTIDKRKPEFEKPRMPVWFYVGREVAAWAALISPAATAGIKLATEVHSHAGKSDDTATPTATPSATTVLPTDTLAQRLPIATVLIGTVAAIVALGAYAYAQYKKGKTKEPRNPHSSEKVKGLENEHIALAKYKYAKWFALGFALISSVLYLTDVIKDTPTAVTVGAILVGLGAVCMTGDKVARYKIKAIDKEKKVQEKLEEGINKLRDRAVKKEMKVQIQEALSAGQFKEQAAIDELHRTRKEIIKYQHRDHPAYMEAIDRLEREVESLELKMQNNEIAILQEILRQKPHLLDYPAGKNEETLLMKAVKSKDIPVQIPSFLIEKKANINAQNAIGATILDVASTNRNKQVQQLLTNLNAKRKLTHAEQVQPAVITPRTEVTKDKGRISPERRHVEALEDERVKAASQVDRGLSLV